MKTSGVDNTLTKNVPLSGDVSIHVLSMDEDLEDVPPAVLPRSWTIVDAIESARTQNIMTTTAATGGKKVDIHTILDPETKTIEEDLLQKYLDMANDVQEARLSVPSPGAVCAAIHETDVNLNIRETIAEKNNVWNNFIGSRYSHRRGLCQLWFWMIIGIIILFITAVNVSTITKDDVLHLGAFDEKDWPLADPFSLLLIQDEVDFTIEYDIIGASQNPEDEFQVLLMDYGNFQQWRNGFTFNFVENASHFTGTTSHKVEPPVFVNAISDEIYVLVVMPCLMSMDDIEVNFCGKNPLPAALGKGNKIYRRHENPEGDTTLILERYKILPSPESCSNSGGKGLLFLLIFLPYVIVLLYALKVPQMLFFGKSLLSIVQTKFEKENGVPEDEVDYWQPLPWDRKTPKTRVCGPCCFKKMRKPTEGFSTWWRHENYFTWIAFPYRNERLSMLERGVIIFASLYITFYVVFLISIYQETLVERSPFSGIILIFLLITILPSIAKSVMKEIFKFIYRTHRKHGRQQRIKALTGDEVKPISVRSVLVVELFVVLLLTIIQIPLFIIWLKRSCAFLREFLLYWAAALVARVSITGTIEDLLWFYILKAFGWNDLCPYCTERLVHCIDFNDNLLIISVAHLGPKWELIQSIDRAENGEKAQFDLYTPLQLAERWTILVNRAKKHIQKVHSYRRRQLKHARRRGASQEVLEKMRKTCTTGDCFKQELLIIKLDGDLDTCPIKKHYESNFVIALSALKASMQVGIEHLHLGAAPSDRRAHHEIQTENRDRIYGSFASTEGSEDSLPVENNEVLDEEFYNLDASSPQSSHSYELVENEDGNMECLDRPTVLRPTTMSITGQIKRQASRAALWLDKFDT